ncbi:pyridoxine 4-dehydrogenase [Rhodococcus sp. 27YEA15]|uniref:oxidoreductase n=1 Tax=Rhodococcus sp. 27YEA15 TaxID=3156259 RepID=UPI003C7ABFE5
MSPRRFRLGSREVSRTGYGAMQLTGPGIFGPPSDHDEAVRVLRSAVEHGIDHIDTAQYYGPDVVNDLIRQALHPYSGDLAIVSKVGAKRGPRGEIFLYNQPDELRIGIEDNVRSLGVDRLAAVNLRMPDSTASPDALFDDQLASLIQARADGLIEGIGLSNISLAHFERATAGTDIVCVQNSLNLLERGSIDILDATAAKGVAFVPFCPLGFPRTQREQILTDPTVLSVAEGIGATPVQIALAWLLHLSPNVLLIPGTSSVGHLVENLAAADVVLDAQSRSRLDAVGKP